MTSTSPVNNTVTSSLEASLSAGQLSYIEVTGLTLERAFPRDFVEQWCFLRAGHHNRLTLAQRRLEVGYLGAAKLAVYFNVACNADGFASLAKLTPIQRHCALAITDQQLLAVYFHEL